MMRAVMGCIFLADAAVTSLNIFPGTYHNVWVLTDWSEALVQHPENLTVQFVMPAIR